MSSPAFSLFSFCKFYYTDPLLYLSILFCNLSIEFFISAIKTFISKSSFLFYEFWRQNLLILIFLLSNFSLLLTSSFVLKTFLKCLRMCGCLLIFRNEVLKVVQKLCGHGLSTGGFTLAHNSVASQIFHWALPTARLCRPFLWDGLVTAENSFLIFWVGWFKPSHYHSEHGREKTCDCFPLHFSLLAPAVLKSGEINFPSLMGDSWVGVVLFGMEVGLWGFLTMPFPVSPLSSINTWAQFLSLAEDVIREMLEEYFQAPKRGMSLQIERAHWMVRKINEKAHITKDIMLKFQNTKA